MKSTIASLMKEFLTNKESENQLERSRIDSFPISNALSRSKMFDDKNNTLIRAERASQNSNSKISDRMNIYNGTLYGKENSTKDSPLLQTRKSLRLERQTNQMNPHKIRDSNKSRSLANIFMLNSHKNYINTNSSSQKSTFGQNFRNNESVTHKNKQNISIEHHFKN